MPDLNRIVMDRRQMSCNAPIVLSDPRDADLSVSPGAETQYTAIIPRTAFRRVFDPRPDHEYAGRRTAILLSATQVTPDRFDTRPAKDLPECAFAKEARNSQTDTTTRRILRARLTRMPGPGQRRVAHSSHSPRPPQHAGRWDQGQPLIVALRGVVRPAGCCGSCVSVAQSRLAR
ncbi:hypothetical protein [Loktanella sp. M215]|uniref:hypothetical protein n=1 Tax=Loktanella sp. M215 TaxID=2675431 RepID=UPI001F243E4A|nr:hypothetical protein [Loktanella sp. M215]